MTSHVKGSSQPPPPMPNINFGLDTTQTLSAKYSEKEEKINVLAEEALSKVPDVDCKSLVEKAMSCKHSPYYHM